MAEFHAWLLMEIFEYDVQIRHEWLVLELRAVPEERRRLPYVHPLLGGAHQDVPPDLARVPVHELAMREPWF